MTGVDAAGRIRAFRLELERRCADRIEPTAFGTAYVNLAFPVRYDSNFVWVRRPPDRVEADALAADADRSLGELGLRHRKVFVDDDARGAALAMGFLDLGWSAERLVVMAERRDPEPRPPAAVRELAFAQARPILEEVLRGQPYVDDAETLRQLTDFRAVLERRAGARFLVADADGRPAAICERYVIDGVAQVEDVNTFEGFRGRGLGSAVVLAASRSARAAGCDLVFLVADDGDWPKELYARLGFDVVSRFWAFVRAG